MDAPTPEALRARFAELSTAELRAITTSADFSALAQTIASELLANRQHSAPARPCPVHPGAEIVGACKRCGTFICVECDPSFARYRRGRCGPCQARTAAVSRVPGVALFQLMLASFTPFGVLVSLLQGRWVSVVGYAVLGGTLLIVGIKRLLGPRRA